LARLEEVAELPPFEPCHDPYDAAQGSDALVLITEWAGIHDLDLPRLRSAMRRPVFIDTRNVFDPAEMIRLGFIYSGIGRGISFKGVDREAAR
jgi:UDPglucose 6-dehydrogenase